MRRLTLSLLLLAAASTAIACDPPPPKPKTANVASAPMPAGESFKGVWFNAFFGELHLVQEGDTVQGRYKSQQNGIWGKVRGKASGDVVHFEWEEYKTGAIGPGSKRKGKGWFKFSGPDETQPAKLKGGWGLDENETGGGSWDCVREKDVPPTPDKIGNDADPSLGNGWDQDPKKK